ARLLERHVAERGGRVSRPPARNREDPDAKRPRAARCRAGRRVALTRKPDFDELIGAETSAAERERLRRTHELLVQAGPPPELTPQLRRAPGFGSGSGSGSGFTMAHLPERRVVK